MVNPASRQPPNGFAKLARFAKITRISTVIAANIGEGIYYLQLQVGIIEGRARPSGNIH
jgi:hypothetical protein